MDNNGRFKVLHIIHTLEGGGIERTVTHLLNLLPDYGIESYAITTHSGSEGNVREHGHRVFHIPKTQRFDLRVSALEKVIRKIGPAVVHCWGATSCPGSYYASRRAGVQVFCCGYQNYYRLMDPLSLLVAYYSWKGDGITSNLPPEVLTWPYSAIFKAKNGVFIPNPVDIEAIKESSPTRPLFSGAEKARIVLYAGRLVAQKNLSLLLDAISLVQKKIPEITLLICGEGALEAELRRQAKTLNIEERVIFTGFRKDIWSMMKAAECVVLCSKYEGMPNTLCEAMVARIPVIASDIPAHRFLLDNGRRGMLVEPGDSRALADALSTCLTSSNNKNETVNEAFNYALTSFSLDAIMQSYVAYYRSFLNL